MDILPIETSAHWAQRILDDDEQVVMRSKPSASAMLAISHQVKTAIGDELYISVNNTKLRRMQDVKEQKRTLGCRTGLMVPVPPYSASVMPDPCTPHLITNKVFGLSLVLQQD